MNLRLKQFIDVYIGKALLVVNLILVRGLGMLLRRNHTLQKPPQTILVIKILGLGSVILASNAIFSLKKKHPNAKLILICGQGVEAGIKPLQLFDEIWTIKDKQLLQMLSSTCMVLFKSWHHKNRWVIDLEVYSVLTTILSAWTGAINRFGFQLDKTNFRNYLNTHNVYFNQFSKVETNYQRLIEAAGVSNHLPFSFPSEFTSNKNHQYIAINNTCSELGGNLRKIPDQLLVKIIQHLLNSTNLKVILLGAPSDFNQIQAFINGHFSNQIRVENIAGKLDFFAYYNLLGNQTLLMLSIDSAPLHIANKLGIQTISFWGPIAPAQRIDNIENALYLSKPCSPCIHHTEVVPCGGNNHCMKDMDFNWVKHKIESHLTNLKNE